jgi:hypothetical protein
MVSLDEVLGRSVLIGEIANALSSQDDSVVRITGEAGSGKTHLALAVGAAWEKEHDGISLVVTGDDRNASRDLYPFLSGVTPVSRYWLNLAGQGSRSALKAVDALTGTGGIAGSIFDLLSSALRQKFEKAVRPLNPIEREVVLDLKRLIRARPSLLIVDNCHWLDRSSLGLLDHLRSPALRDAIPDLARLRILIVDTADDQAPTAPQSFNQLTRAIGEKVWRLKRCQQDQFSTVLAAMGLRSKLPDSVLETLYATTGAHLKLCEQLVTYMNGVSEPSFDSLQLGQDLLQKMIGERLAGMGATLDQLTAHSGEGDHAFRRMATT